MATVPSLRPARLERIFDTQEQLADALRAAFPGELDNVEAVAMVGGVIGAGLAAGLVAVRDGTPSAARRCAAPSRSRCADRHVRGRPVGNAFSAQALRRSDRPAVSSCSL